MKNTFIRMIYAYLKENGVDTKELSVQSAIDKYQAMQNKTEHSNDDKALTKNIKSVKLPIKATEFRVKKDRENHFRHVGEMGCRTFKEYNAKAKNFLNVADGDVYEFKQGTQQRYSKFNHETKEFAVCRFDGTIVTYYILKNEQSMLKQIKGKKGKKL